MLAPIFPAFLLAASVLAFPSSKERFEARLAARDVQTQSQPLQPAEDTLSVLASAVGYSTNWAGGIYTKPNGTITGVTGTFTVPKPSMPPGGDTSTSYSGTAWVGIDGASCHRAILQSGVDWHIKNGKVSYGAWYEWFPAAWVDFSGITFKAGDSVTITVKASSSKNGTATIKNNSNGQSVSHAVNAGTKPALCQADVEWIVEDYAAGGLVPFADFGTVTFTDASATLTGGSTIGVANAGIIDMRKNGTVVAASTVSSSGVKVVYQ